MADCWSQQAGEGSRIVADPIPGIAAIGAGHAAAGIESSTQTMLGELAVKLLLAKTRRPSGTALPLPPIAVRCRAEQKVKVCPKAGIWRLPALASQVMRAVVRSNPWRLHRDGHVGTQRGYAGRDGDLRGHRLPGLVPRGGLRGQERQRTQTARLVQHHHFRGHIPTVTPTIIKWIRGCGRSVGRKGKFLQLACVIPQITEIALNIADGNARGRQSLECHSIPIG
jgi:hypothetical protein